MTVLRGPHFCLFEVLTKDRFKMATTKWSLTVISKEVKGQVMLSFCISMDTAVIDFYSDNRDTATKKKQVEGK